MFLDGGNCFPSQRAGLPLVSSYRHLFTIGGFKPISLRHSSWAEDRIPLQLGCESHEPAGKQQQTNTQLCCQCHSHLRQSKVCICGNQIPGVLACCCCSLRRLLRLLPATSATPSGMECTYCTYGQHRVGHVHVTHMRCVPFDAETLRATKSTV